MAADESPIAADYRRERMDGLTRSYESEVVGDYVADLIVGDEVVVELKAVTNLDRVHHAQCVHYLRATGIPVCLLLNFGRRSLEVRRIVNRF